MISNFVTTTDTKNHIFTAGSEQQIVLIQQIYFTDGTESLTAKEHRLRVADDPSAIAKSSRLNGFLFKINDKKTA